MFALLPTLWVFVPTLRPPRILVSVDLPKGGPPERRAEIIESMHLGIDSMPARSLNQCLGALIQ